MQHHGYLVTESLHVVLPHVTAAYTNRTFACVIQPADQVHQAGLTAACTADNANGFATLNVQVNILQGRFAGSVFVRKANMVEVNLSVGNIHHRFRRIGQVGLLIQHFRNTASAGKAHGQHHEDHAQHHQGHEHTHHITEQAGQFARGQFVANNKLGTEPAQCDNASVHHQHHHRAVDGDGLLSLHEQAIHIFRSLVELLLLVVFPNEGLHHTNGRNVFLHAGVQVVILVENIIEQPHSPTHNEDQANGQHRNCHQEHQRQLMVDHKAHHHRQNHGHRSTHRNTQHHLIRILDIGYICGHTCNQACRGELINIRKGECLNVLIHGIAQIGCKTAGCRSRKLGRQQPEQQAQHGHGHHQQAIPPHILDTAPLNALINELGGYKGNQHLHQHLQCRKQRREQGSLLILLHLSKKSFDHKRTPFLLT